MLFPLLMIAFCICLLLLLVLVAATVQSWSVTGVDQHPFHTHINHMQFGSQTNANTQWPNIPNW